MQIARMIKGLGGVCAVLALTACDLQQRGLDASPSPEARPPDLVVAPPPPIFAERSDASRQLSVHYRRVEDDLVARGLLRTDGGGPDTTFTDTILARNFVRIALFDEFINQGGNLQARPTISRLKRWEQPVRFAVEFGASVPDAQRTQDDAEITDYVARLSRITGHPMSVSDAGANFHVLVLNEDDRLGFEQRLRGLVPGIDDTSVRAFLDVPRDTLCLVLAFSRGDQPDYSQAVALIRAEHPDLMRQACIHEELAQGLGLANDSPRARPSIFNDDEEFGLLTTHDELLLQMLYDDRLQPGMSAAEAAPIARRLADEIMNGTAS